MKKQVNLIRDKKGAGILAGTIIFILLNLVFFAALFYFIGVKSTGAGLHEQVYAKQIALLIDGAKPGTSIEVDISKLYETAEKKNYLPEKSLVEINSATKEVTVRLTNTGKGYSFKHFNDAVIVWGEDSAAKKLNIQVKKPKF